METPIDYNERERIFKSTIEEMTKDKENRDATIAKLTASIADRDGAILRLNRRLEDETKYKEQARGEAEAYMNVIDKLIERIKAD